MNRFSFGEELDMDTTVSIHIVDDDAEICELLAGFLASHGYFAERHASADAFLASPSSDQESGRPMLVISDVRMPGRSGVGLLRLLRERAQAKGAALSVILLSGQATVPVAVEAMRSGAVHFLEKPVDPDALLETVRTVCLELEDARAGAEADCTARARLNSLTPREREVLVAFVARGSNKAVANALRVSPRTVEVHRASIFRKSGASCVTELVRLALEAGFVESGSRNRDTPSPSL
jgi:two-component system response regulator FixJ